MIVKPNNKILQKYVEHYWIVTEAHQLFGNHNFLYAYPGITPDLIIVLDGYYTFDYLGRRYRDNTTQLFGFIHDKVFLDPTALKAFIIVRFKSRGLNALQPFVKITSNDLIHNSVSSAESIFGTSIDTLTINLRTIDQSRYGELLDEWFLKQYNNQNEGFFLDIVEEVSPKFSIKELMLSTKYSYSTIERHFKKETGITPKKYQSLRRFKSALEELYISKNKDWMHYVTKYEYFDQSHFIKEIKQFSGFTPSQLISIPSISEYRPR